ncbi:MULTISPECIES: type II TA system antitoxin MqsA family protein [unclassified Enterococcus]|uniref:type II TA system antitoxin MqsA family protein n=1 Tax=unclassified Enterococcus TaxID=2608891 RepID=UPI001A912E7C|nr:helix-turn-helix domain-containing protein [Enterococcus sp. DIV1298c]MBO1299670.1 helix-turn-helix domain-containing protein [Enterococcus sp. DIV1271a]
MNNYFCEACGIDSSFTRTTLVEYTTVKELDFKNTHTYYKCDKCGEMFEPFDNYDLNYLSDYEKYSEIKGLLTYKEIKAIRKTYGLSQRDLSKLLAISHATISRLEKGEILSEQQDVLFRLVAEPYAFYKSIVRTRKHVLKKEVAERLEERLKYLIADDYVKHREEAEKWYEQVNEKKKII